MPIRPVARLIRPLGAALLAAQLAACATGGPELVAVEGAAPQGRQGPAHAPSAAGGGYYLDDGPGQGPAPDLDAIPDAVPRIEPLHRGATRPYSALGNDYTPMTRLGPYRARGVASWYGRRYHGKATSTGERYDMYAMSAAHTTLPLPSYARITSVATGRSVVVRVNDRGPFARERLIDLSYAAAHRLGLVQAGSGLVDVEAIVPEGGATAVADPPPPAPPAVPGPGAPPQARGHYLQLGAFAERANAEDLVRKLQTTLPDLTPAPAVVSDGNLHRVRAGPFPDRDSARREAERVASRLGGRPLVVTP